MTNPLNIGSRATRFMTRYAGMAAVAALVASGGAPAWAADMSISAQLSGRNEVPPNNSPATGKLNAQFNPETRTLKWSVTHEKLTGPVTAAHFHGPAGSDQNAPPVVNFSSQLTSPIEGQAVLTPEQVKDLMAGKWYVNLHTAANPGGEIRGQAMPAK
ncbi:MAG: CHRD domain-containing protein [Pseudomonadota bacterium]